MIFKSPVKHFPGVCVLPDHLSFPQVVAVERAAAKAAQAEYITEQHAIFLPVILSIASEWDIKHMPENPTLDTWPPFPRKASEELIDALVVAIQEIYIADENAIPND